MHQKLPPVPRSLVGAVNLANQHMALLRLDRRAGGVGIRTRVEAAVEAVLVLVLVGVLPEGVEGGEVVQGVGAGAASQLLGGEEGGEVVQGVVKQVGGAGGDSNPFASLSIAHLLCRSRSSETTVYCVLLLILFGILLFGLSRFFQ